MEHNIISFTSSANESDILKMIRTMMIKKYTNSIFSTNSHKDTENIVICASGGAIVRSYISKPDTLLKVIRQAKEQSNQYWHLLLESAAITRIINRVQISDNISISWAGVTLPINWENLPIKNWYLAEYIVDESLKIAISAKGGQIITFPKPYMSDNNDIIATSSAKISVEDTQIDPKTDISPCSVTRKTNSNSEYNTNRQTVISGLIWMAYQPESAITTLSLFTSCTKKINNSNKVANDSMANIIQLLTNIKYDNELTNAKIITSQHVKKTWLNLFNEPNLHNMTTAYIREILHISAENISNYKIAHESARAANTTEDSWRTVLQNFIQDTENNDILILHGDAISCISYDIINEKAPVKREYIYVALTNDMSSQNQRWIRGLHEQGYFNLLDTSRETHAIHYVDIKPIPRIHNNSEVIRDKIIQAYLEEEAVNETRLAVNSSI